MGALARLLKDRRRSQRGSVLSAVLIMVAFLAIICGALMTELSTNFLLSRTAVSRVANEAVVNSAMELAFSRLQDTQTTPLFQGCPSLPSVALNGSNGAATYASCYPVIDRGSPQQLSSIVSGGQFLQDGTHAVIPGAGVDAYLNADANGNLYSVPTGSTTPAWTYGFGGEIVGTPLAMPDLNAQPAGISYVVPVTNPTGGAANGCSAYCVGLLNAAGPGKPSFTCLMSANGPVMSQPAAGIAFSSDAYFGDSAGNLFAYSALSNQAGPCDQEDAHALSSDLSGTSQVVAGPFVINGSTGKRATDEVYVFAAAGGQGYLMRYAYTTSRGSTSFIFAGATPLPGVPSGAVLQRSTSRFAVGFTNGTVALIQVNFDFSTTLFATSQLAAPVSDAPVFSAGGQVGVAAGSTLYVLDQGLNLLATFAAPSSIATSPAADSGGDWFIATSSGTAYGVQRAGSSAQMFATFGYGGAGRLTSSPIAVPCATGICLYTASSDGSVYFAGLDARDAVLDTCLTACGSTTFSLRAVVEVGAPNSPSTVHVQGWSYYSP